MFRSFVNSYLDQAGWIDVERKKIEDDNIKCMASCQYAGEDPKFTLHKFDDELDRWKTELKQVHTGRLSIM